MPTRTLSRFMSAVKQALVITLPCAMSTSVAGQDLLQQITATDGVACEQFGHGLAFDGNRIVVGAAAAPDDPPLACASGSGAAYVFDRHDSIWLQAYRL